MGTGASDRGEHLAFLDGLRGLAILGVVAFHAAGTSGPSWAPDAGRIGAHGVDLFFVLSGYCLSLRTFAGDAGPTTVRAHVRFVLARFARVAPAYYVALAAFVALSFSAFGCPSVVAAPPAGSPAAWWEALRDAVFLTSAAPSYDASFWSLGFEMRWYLLYPVLIALYRRSRPAFGLVALALYALYFSPWTLGDAGSLPCFMLGIVAASRARANGAFERAAPLLALVAVACASVRQALDPNVDHGDPLWHAACFLVVLGASRASVRDALSWSPLRVLGVGVVFGVSRASAAARVARDARLLTRRCGARERRRRDRVLDCGRAAARRSIPRALAILVIRARRPARGTRAARAGHDEQLTERSCAHGGGAAA